MKSAGLISSSSVDSNPSRRKEDLTAAKHKTLEKRRRSAHFLCTEENIRYLQRTSQTLRDARDLYRTSETLIDPQRTSETLTEHHRPLQNIRDPHSPSENIRDP
ncbi:hypothetical protein DPX16_10180 [Anabarilius grahami]|uniref:Uncharacterized protein n=1 Tax=Anabarilius grahami TaxID=495550 RepID=A0A3N0XZ28_ANAGA|nr:hypothetical protein DPX16_10180 [Anabarilius grahami]